MRHRLQARAWVACGQSSQRRQTCTQTSRGANTLFAFTGNYQLLDTHYVLEQHFGLSTTISSRLKVERGPPAIVGKCPTQPSRAGQRYRDNSIYMDKTRTMSWSWHPYPYNAFSADCWVEVEHKADPFGDEHYGMWFMQAAGSGMWFNSGSTLAFAEHNDAMAHFGVTHGNKNEEMCKAAAAAGLDSLQFSAHVDSVQYRDCDTKHTGVKGLEYMNMEIVAVKAVGTYACGSAVGAPRFVRAGWSGSKPCVCDNSKGFLNCAGVVTMEGDLRVGVVLV